MSRSRLFDRIAQVLVSWGSDEARASELRGHLAESEAAGDPVNLAGLASLGTLVARRAARDIPWWIAGLPVAFLFLAFAAFNYETHFFAWDVVGPDEHPRTAATTAWISAVTALTITMVIAGLCAGRVAIQHLRSGRVIGPLALVAAILVAISQGDLFVDRTPWWRDGSLRAEHVNEVPVYSVLLFLLVTMIPLVYLLASALVWKRFKRTGEPTAQITSELEVVENAEVDAVQELDSVALAAAILPLLVVFVGFPVLFLTLIFTWGARSFTTRLKAVVTAALLVPLLVAFFWENVIADIDDGHPAVIFGVLGMWVVVWLRMTFVAFGPLRALRVQFHYEQV